MVIRKFSSKLFISKETSSFAITLGNFFVILLNLINELEKFSELKRIRYTTSHPRDMTDDLIECYRKIDPTSYTDIYDDLYLKR